MTHAIRDARSIPLLSLHLEGICKSSSPQSTLCLVKYCYIPCETLEKPG